MCSSRKFRRFMALLLTIVMMVGMAPSVMAETTVGSAGSSSFSGSYGTSGGEWAFQTPFDTFTRYTLVRFSGDSVESIEWETSEGSGYHTYYNVYADYGASAAVIGSVDISGGMYRGSSTEDQDTWSGHTAPSSASYVGTRWYNTNAVGYADEGADFVKWGTSYNVTWANSSITSEALAAGTVSGETLFGENHFLSDEEFVAWASNTSNTGISIDTSTFADSLKLDPAFYSQGASYTNANIFDDYLRDSTTDTGYVYEFNGSSIDGYYATDMMKALLSYLFQPTLMAWDSTFGAWTGSDLYQLVEQAKAAGLPEEEAILRAFFDMPADDTFSYDASTDGVQYKLIVETGTVVKLNNTVTYFAMTTRDMCAFAELAASGDSDYAFCSTLATWIGSAAINPAIAIYSTSDEFYWYTGGTTSGNTISITTQAATPFAFTTVGSGLITSLKSLSYSALRNMINSGSNYYIFGDAANGLGVGILSGYMFTAEITTKDPGEVVIKKTDAGTGATLEGATFLIEDITDGSLTLERTTDEDGEIILDIKYDNLVVGHTYLVTESDPPTGYELIDTPQEFTIVEDSDGNLSADPSTLTFEDPAAEGEAHLLIDYNMNGFSATVGTSGG